MKIAVAQINTTIGDFDGNTSKILGRMDWAAKMGADILVFPELCVCGYMPKDLLEKPSFIRMNLEHVDKIASKTGDDVAVVLGFVSKNESRNGRPLYNSVGLLRGGKVEFVQHKTLIPEYDVFDEGRYFEPATEHATCRVKGLDIGLTACEDLWSMYEFGGRKIYHHDPMMFLTRAGANAVINLSASPFTLEKHDIRKDLITKAASRFKVPIIYCNLVGGNDELVFDGRSFVVDEKGRVVHEAAAFEEDSFAIDLDSMKPMKAARDIQTEEMVQKALVLGLKDYMRKCGYRKVVIGLSGGIDSSVVAAIACEALGCDNVIGVMMPSPFTSKESLDDAKALAQKLGMTVRLIPIGSIYESYRGSLGFKHRVEEVSLVEENLQARIRGNILMAISNREGSLVISTGNKSELSVGYCTLYGDMVGGLALISDVPKTMVYSLAEHLNAGGEIIPRRIIEKPPSAELKPGQIDQDALPPYDELDRIISAYVEDHMSIDAMVEKGISKGVAERVVGMIDRNEYKRRQATPGIKITSKAYGMGRRFPIARKF